VFATQPWTLVPWGIGGLVLGYYCRKLSHAFTTGVVYGFVLVFVFMSEQYTGTVPVIRRFPFFGILAAFGAVCGVFLCLAGFLVRKRVRA
jgi:hypothetical protein